MKEDFEFDSEWLEIEINPWFFTIDGKTKVSESYVEIWDDGDIFISYEDNKIMLRYEELEEIVRAYKTYVDKRNLIGE